MILVITALHILFITIQLFVVYLLLQALFSVPYVRSSEKDKELLLDIIETSKGESFIDIGSGDGMICRFVARNSNIKVSGVEINAILVFFSKFTNLFQRKKVIYMHKNFKNIKLDEFEIIYAFLLPEYIEEIINKLDPKNNKLLISHKFKVPGVQDQEKIGNYYVYKVK